MSSLARRSSLTVQLPVSLSGHPAYVHPNYEYLSPCKAGEVVSTVIKESEGSAPLIGICSQACLPSYKGVRVIAGFLKEDFLGVFAKDPGFWDRGGKLGVSAEKHDIFQSTGERIRFLRECTTEGLGATPHTDFWDIVRGKPSVEDFLSNDLDIEAIEVSSLEEMLHLQSISEGSFRTLKELGGTVGYGHVVFTQKETLKNNWSEIKEFLDACQRKWEDVLQGTPLKLPDDDGPSLHSVKMQADMVAQTRSGPLLGVMQKSDFVQTMSSMGGSLSLWGADKHQCPEYCMVSECISRPIMNSTREIATGVLNKTKKKPCLAVVNVGHMKDNHWGHRNAVQLGLDLGIKVKQVNLPVESTTEEVIATINSCRKYDAIQLNPTFPLPQHIDAKSCYLAIPRSKDCDGVYFIGDADLSGGLESSNIMPTAVEAVLKIFEYYGIDVDGANVAVIGRTRNFGRPLSYALTQLDATVTTAHSKTQNLENVVSNSDVVINCLGDPSLPVVDEEWVKEGSVVVYVRNCEDPYDIKQFGKSRLFLPSATGVGPLSLTVLMKNVAELGLRRMRKALYRVNDINNVIIPEQNSKSSNGSQWTTDPVNGLVRNFTLDSSEASQKFIDRIIKLGDELNHHPNFETHHQKEVGSPTLDGTVDVQVRWSTKVSFYPQFQI